MRRIAYFLLIAVVLVGCKSSKRLTATKVPEVTASEAAIPSYLASRLQLTIPGKGGSMSVGGTMKMKSRERVQISLLNRSEDNVRHHRHHRSQHRLLKYYSSTG